MNAAVKVLHDAIGDRQSKSQALSDRLGRNERIEDPPNELRRNAGPIVRNANATNSLATRASISDRRLFHLGCSVERVADEIDQHLLELHRVA